jgi:GNAT superfamily N-acetyltransferase
VRCARCCRHGWRCNRICCHRGAVGRSRASPTAPSSAAPRFGCFRRARKDLEISFQLRPEEWGKGYATEAAGALIRWAFAQDAEELFAVVLPHNTRAIATIERLGMEWVGETTKYYDRTLQVYRIRPGDVSDA